MMMLEVIGVALFVVIAMWQVIAAQRQDNLKKTVKKSSEEYLAKTEVCPTCYGRGRVCKDGYEFTDDKYKEKYEIEKDIPTAFTREFNDL